MFSLRVFPHMKVSELETRDIAWAFYSNSQDTLLEICNSATDNKLVWKRARAMGVGLWLKSADALVSLHFSFLVLRNGLLSQWRGISIWLMKIKTPLHVLYFILH